MCNNFVIHSSKFFGNRSKRMTQNGLVRERKKEEEERLEGGGGGKWGGREGGEKKKKRKENKHGNSLPRFVV